MGETRQSRENRKGRKQRTLRKGREKREITRDAVVLGAAAVEQVQRAPHSERAGGGERGPHVQPSHVQVSIWRQEVIGAEIRTKMTMGGGGV
jgi:hypothetical protein